MGLGTSTLLSTLDARAASATQSVASFSGSTNFATLVADQTGSGDLFTASVSGLTKFLVNNAGNVTISNLNTAGGVVYTSATGLLNTSAQGSSNQCLISNAGSAPSWVNCAAGTSSFDVWNSGSGAIFPLNSTMDLLVGGQSTAAAKFAFINVNSGTPTATIAGSVAGNALSITGDGAISNAQNKTLALNANGGNVTIGNAPNTLTLT